MADHELHVLNCGTLTFPRYGIYYNGGEEEITVPIPAYLLTHPEGHVVYDTGFPLACATDPHHFARVGRPVCKPIWIPIRWTVGKKRARREFGVVRNASVTLRGARRLVAGFEAAPA